MATASEERKRRIKGFITGYLLETGLITLEQLDLGLDRQLELLVQGRSMRLGQVLVEMGLITPEQLDQAQTRMWTDGVEGRAVTAGDGGQEERGV